MAQGTRSIVKNDTALSHGVDAKFMKIFAKLKTNNSSDFKRRRISCGGAFSAVSGFFLPPRVLRYHPKSQGRM
jgi:hypothetical protein